MAETILRLLYLQEYADSTEEPLLNSYLLTQVSYALGSCMTKRQTKADKTRNPENLRHLKTMYLFTVRPLCIPDRYSAVLHSVRVCNYDIPAFANIWHFNILEIEDIVRTTGLLNCGGESRLIRSTAINLRPGKFLK
jgi:hypothetical protein